MAKANQPIYSSASPERLLLGVCLLLSAVLMFLVVYVLQIPGFIMFLTILGGGLLLFLPVHRNFMNMNGRAVLITGCDTGFGHGLAKRMDQLGCTVYAGCLFADGEGAQKLRSECSDKLHVVPLDVSSEDSVGAALKFVKDTTGDLWAVMNNAGINYLGDAELVSTDQFRKVGDINMYGVVRVTKAFLPLLKETKGRVISVSSVKGLVAFPICSHYNMSKFGIEAFSDSLRVEMRPWGVHVSIVEPANFGGITSGLLPAERDYNDIWSKLSPELREVYGREYIDLQIQGAKDSAQTTHPSMEPVLDAMVESIVSEFPQYRYLIGGGKSFYDFYKWLAVLHPFIPTFLRDRFIAYLFSLPTPKALKN